jgi:hypothetical protein
MRIFVHGHRGHGFPAWLSRSLAAAGHQVRYAHPSSSTTPGSVELGPGDPDGFSVVGIVSDEAFATIRLPGRTRQELRYVSLFAGEVRAFAPDVVISAGAPLFTQRGISRWCRTVGLPQVLWLRDVSSTAMARQARRRLGPAGSVAARALTELEGAACRDADAVVAGHEELRPFLRRAGVEADRITVIEDVATVTDPDLAQSAERFLAVIHRVLAPEPVL